MAKKLSEEKIAEIKEKAAICKDACELAKICGVSVTSARKYGFPERYKDLLAYQNQYQKDYREYCASIGVCTRCKTRPAMTGFKLCEYCSNQIDDRREQRNRERGHTRSERDIERQRNYAKATRQYRKEHGLCVQCGRPALPGKTTCNECRIKRNRNQRERSERNGKVKHWKEDGFCIRCGKERKPGYMYCQACYDKQLEYVSKAKEASDISGIRKENHNKFVQSMYKARWIKTGR